MKLIKFVFKIIAAPLVVVLTIATPIFTFLFCYAATLLEIVSGIGVLVSIALLISGEKLGCGVFLFLSFLISPFGIPAIAEWLIDRLRSLNYSLRYFIMS
ncbi:CD1845 family protein [Candidatus Galacturonibacter soehngenii]|uniref:Uncharacterized protein n=1 Tax=Candidatus Galacturonatibacter soehngenii TaxID=2307010 RepID=A0A7V7UAC6_9FIRM|nr:CD1845 family protein [Candidatus Galacturonibacter soehngenii]KAB1434226.1 hypothetical protein F7O84_17155 [Candidatus Galacturonibacter soehngenii]